jgi:non-ribosomal peptide synthetase component F
LPWHGYGAIETIVYSTLVQVERSVPVTIGRPIANTRVYLVGRHRQPVPVGVTRDVRCW